LKKLIQNEQFLSLFEQKVKEEEMKPLPIWTPLEIFVEMAKDIDALTDDAAVLINLEHPTRYLLIDVLSVYIKTDSRFESLRKMIPYI